MFSLHVFNKFLPKVGCCFFALVLAAHAERADREKPVNIGADTLHYDGQKQTGVFSGSVVLTQGSMVIRGDRMEFRQDPQGHAQAKVLAEAGKTVVFHQKRDTVDEYVEGEAHAVDYDGMSRTVTLKTQAKLRRYRGAVMFDEFSADVIVVNDQSEVFSLDGGKGRVRVMLMPKSAVPAQTAASGLELRSSPTLP